MEDGVKTNSKITGDADGLTDLPAAGVQGDETKGGRGSGTALPSVTDIIIDPFNPNRLV